MSQALAIRRSTDVIEGPKRVLELPECRRLGVDLPPPGAGQAEGAGGLVVLLELGRERGVRCAEHPVQGVTRRIEGGQDVAGRRYRQAADLDQRSLSLDTRLNVTFTPNMTLQLFAQPFISSNDYSDWKEYEQPREWDRLVYGEDIGTVDVVEDAAALATAGRVARAVPV